MNRSGQQSPAPSDTMPLVYVVVLNWNQWRMTADCLQSLAELDYPNRQVLVVDNGSRRWIRAQRLAEPCIPGRKSCVAEGTTWALPGATTWASKEPLRPGRNLSGF